MSLEYETVSLGEHLYIKGRIGWKGLKKDEYLEIEKNLKEYLVELGFNMTPIEAEFVIWDAIVNKKIKNLIL